MSKYTVEIHAFDTYEDYLSPEMDYDSDDQPLAVSAHTDGDLEDFVFTDFLDAMRFVLNISDADVIQWQKEERRNSIAAGIYEQLYPSDEKMRLRFACGYQVGELCWVGTCKVLAWFDKDASRDVKASGKYVEA